MKCDFYGCKNCDNKPVDKNNCVKVITEGLGKKGNKSKILDVCFDCILEYNHPNGEIFTCTNCKKLFEVQGAVFPCEMNDGTCPCLCTKCYKSTGEIIFSDLGIFCKKHLHNNHYTNPNYYTDNKWI